MFDIVYTLIRQRRSSISIVIESDASVVVKAPKLMPKFFIDRFVTEKSDWIRKKVAQVKDIHPVLKRKYQEGEEFLYLGNLYKIVFYVGTEIAIKDNNLLFPKALAFRMQKELVMWYQKKAQEVITKRIEYHADKMNASYTSLFFSDTKSKWGSCGPKNDLQFNWKLIMAPLVVIDYVVIHELAHTKHKNHGEYFWDLVAAHTPAYKSHRKWLRSNAHAFVV